LADEAFFGTLVLESALWWYVVADVIDAIRRRRLSKTVSAKPHLRESHLGRQPRNSGATSSSSGRRVRGAASTD
jgi:hypothetical protein